MSQGDMHLNNGRKVKKQLLAKKVTNNLSSIYRTAKKLSDVKVTSK
jgi:hypothetical protein